MNAGANALGFIFYPKSPRYVSPAKAAELGQDLAVWKVGIFVDENRSVCGTGPLETRSWTSFNFTVA